MWLAPNESVIMTDWLAAIILGIIEGITEFIPVSSTGHLLLAEQFIHLDGQRLKDTFFGTDVFNAVIQSFAMLAALPLRRPSRHLEALA